MNSLDFLNSSPHYYIFGQKYNKTHFGGVLFLIFLILMFFISLLYILDFAINEKHEIESDILNNFYSSFTTNRNFEENKNFQESNINVDFKIALEVNLDNNIDLNILLDKIFLNYDGKLYKGFIYEDFSIFFNITKRMGDSKTMKIIYKCDNLNCSNIDTPIFYSIWVTTNDFEINHEAPIPLIINECIGFLSCSSMAYSSNQPDEENISDLDIELSTIIYEEKKGISRLFYKMFNKSNRYEISYIESLTRGEWNRDLERMINQKENKEYYSLVRITTYPNNKYIKYKRNEIGFLDVIANIGALFSTFFNIFVIIFNLYSNNFDNYKIINKILQQEKEGKNKKQIKLDDNKFKEIELINLNTEKNILNFPLMDDNYDEEKENNEEEKDSEIKTDIEKNKSDLNSIDSIQKKEVDKEEENKILPKLSFFDFYFNNIYFKKCKRRENQDILDMCNKIISKYISIDSVLYNQLIFESLLKDYKWNDPSIINLPNNELLNNLLKFIIKL